MANQTYPKATIERTLEPAAIAYERFTARIELESKPSQNPNQLGAIRHLVERFTEAGVPNDAYVQLSYPVAWANWERPPRDQR